MAHTHTAANTVAVAVDASDVSKVRLLIVRRSARKLAAKAVHGTVRALHLCIFIDVYRREESNVREGLFISTLTPYCTKSLPS